MVRPVSPEKLAIRAAVAKVKITDHLDAPSYISSIYQLTKAELDSFSYIRFAEFLGFGRTNMLRLIVVGERPLTVKVAQKIADGFELHGDERRYFTTLAAFSRERDPGERDRLLAALIEYKQRSAPQSLSATEQEYFSKWYNPVLREMVSLKEFNPNHEWIRERLQFPLHLADLKHGLELLERLGFIQKDEQSGQYRRTHQKMHTAPEVEGLTSIQFHHKMMDIAKESITTVAESEREITSLTTTLPASIVPEIKEKIRHLLDEVERLETAPGERREVFQLNIQFFPFTKGERK